MRLSIFALRSASTYPRTVRASERPSNCSTSPGTRSSNSPPGRSTSVDRSGTLVDGITSR